MRLRSADDGADGVVDAAKPTARPDDGFSVELPPAIVEGEAAESAFSLLERLLADFGAGVALAALDFTRRAVR